MINSELQLCKEGKHQKVGGTEKKDLWIIDWDNGKIVGAKVLG